MALERGQKLRYLDPEIIEKIANLDLVAREVVEGVRVGVHKSPLSGFSTEFTWHRPYVHGDELRKVDWRVYGRTERYYVKLFEAETNFSATLLLDASRSMHYSSEGLSKLEYAKYMAAALAYLIVEQRDSVGLAVFDSELKGYVEPKGTHDVIINIAQELEKAEPVPRTNVSRLLHEFAERIPRRQFVILFSDLFDHVGQFIQGLDHLRFREHNITVFHVLDPYELEFPFQGSMEFIGLENEGQIVTQPRRIRNAYMDELRRFLRQIKQGCDRAHVDYVLVDTSRPIHAVITEYLAARQRTILVR